MNDLHLIIKPAIFLVSLFSAIAVMALIVDARANSWIKNREWENTDNYNVS
jgi:hypothetical protein